MKKFIRYTLLYFIRANQCNQLGLFYNFIKFNPLVLIYQDLYSFCVKKLYSSY